MSMNREQKRMLQRQGEVDADGEPIRQRRQAQQQRNEERTGFRQFLREIRSELRKVAWPTRSEVINYSIVVLVTLVIITSMIALMDWGFGEGLLKLFER